MLNFTRIGYRATALLADGCRVLVILVFAALHALTVSAQSETAPDLAQLQGQLVKEQIESQRAQAAYYRKQTENKLGSDYLVTMLTNAAGTFFGAALALTGVLWTNRRNRRMEDLRWERSRSDELVKQVRLAAADLAKRVAAGAQATSWLLWIAKYEPENLTEKDISAFDREMKSLYSELVGAEVALAVLDKSLFDKMKPLVNSLYKLDQSIAEHTRHFKAGKKSPDKTIETANRLGDLYPAAYKLQSTIPTAILDSVGHSLELPSPQNT